MSDRKIKYAVYRYGANASNQGSTHKLLVAIVEAKNRDEAIECEQVDNPTIYDAPWLRLDSDVTVYANQTLDAVPLSRASRVEVREFEEQSASADSRRSAIAAQQASDLAEIAAERAAYWAAAEEP